VHDFSKKSPGEYYPQAGVTEDPKGNIWGTTYYGGRYGAGVVFKISRSGVYQVVYNFGTHPADGANPTGSLVADPKGNIWGTTQNGGKFGNGTAFEIKP
jgi:uncharacterized repeat protein (TIGR03803 family)